MNKRNLAVRVTATVLSAMLLALAGCGASTGKSAGSVNFTAAAEDMGNGNKRDGSIFHAAGFRAW